MSDVAVLRLVSLPMVAASLVTGSVLPMFATLGFAATWCCGCVLIGERRVDPARAKKDGALKEMQDLADEVARLRLNGTARFHFDPSFVAQETPDRTRLDAWITRHVDGASARMATSCLAAELELVPDGGASDLRNEDVAHRFIDDARDALASAAKTCAEYGTAFDGHAAIAQMLEVHVFSVIRLRSMLRLQDAGVGPGHPNPVLAMLMGDREWRSVRSGADMIASVDRILRAEAAMNIACDAVLAGDRERAAISLAAVADEMQGDDPLLPAIERMMRRIKQS